MKIPLTQLSLILCCLIYFNAFAQPNPDPDPDIPCIDFGIGVVYAENTYGLVGIPEYYSICYTGNQNPTEIKYTAISLPPGYTLNSDSPTCAELRGIKSEPGTFSIKIEGSTPEGCIDTVTITQTWNCLDGDFDPYEFPASFNVGEHVNEGLRSVAYASYSVFATYEVTAGTLPPGLSLAAGKGDTEYDGYLTGQPTTSGIYTFTIRAYLGTNCAGFTRTYTVEVQNPECDYFGIGVITSENTYGVVGIPEYYDICNTGTNEPVQFTPVSLLPGYTLTADGAACTDLNGAVMEPGTFTMKILGTTPSGCTDTLTITNTWRCIDVEFDPYEFPASFNIGQDVHEGLRSVSFGSFATAANYEVTAGTLPPGLSLQPSYGDLMYDAYLTGQPTTPGIYTFAIRSYLGDCAGFTRTYTVQILGGYAPQSLVLTPRCADSIAVRNWEIYNPNENAYILVNWELLYEPSYNGTIIAPPGYTTFQTPNVMNPNTIRISWQDGITGTRTLVRGASSELCNPPACVIGASIVSYHQGFQKNGQAVPTQFSDPIQALGEPDASDSPSDPPRHFSLGYNGFIVVELSSNLSDQPGNDLTIHEMSFGDPSFSSHPERAEVFVSQNGTQWVSLGLTGSAQDCNAPLDKSFDLAGKITWCRYVKIVDKTDRHAKILTPITCAPTNTFAFGAFTNGFDVDAISCGIYTSTLASARIVSEESFTSGTTEHILYPNPVNDWVTIDLSQEKELTLPENRQIQVDIRDMSGRSVYTQLHTLDPDLTTRCNMIDFQSGLFVLHVRTPQGGRFYKLTKQ